MVKRRQTFCRVMVSTAFILVFLLLHVVVYVPSTAVSVPASFQQQS